MTTRAGRKTKFKGTTPGELGPGPTPERLAKSGGAFNVGDNPQGAKIITFMDGLARLLDRKSINDQQYRALAKFRHHHNAAGLEPSYGSADLNRVFGGDNGFAGMAKTEGQVFHRQQYRAAVQIMGMITARVVTAVVCEDRTLEDVGAEVLGWNHPLQSRAAAITKLRDAGDRLAEEWGI